MHLLYPSFLWALAALAIPIVVHLFNFRKAKLVRFSNVKFLETVKKKSASTRNLKHLLILASRLLFIFFLVLTFAQPFLPGSDQGLNSSQVDIYIDNSPSLSNMTQENIAGLASAVSIGEQILDLYSDNVKFRLLTNNFDPSSNNYRSKENTLNALFEIDYSSVVRSGDDVLNRLTRTDPVGNDIFVISDFQKSTMGNLNDVSDSLNQFHFIPIFFTDFSNLLVDSAYLKTPFVIDGQRNQLITQIRNPTPQGTGDIAVKFQLNGRLSATASVNLEPQSKKEVVFELGQNLQNINRGVISIEDYPMTFDNDYSFSFNRVKNIQVVEINESTPPSEVAKVFQASALFNFKSYQKGNISYPDVQNADLLILNNLSNIENGLRNPITSLLKAGKSVVIIPNDQCDPLNLNETIGLIMTKAENPEKNTLETPNVNHPFFENIFEEPSNRSIQPSATIIWQWQTMADKILQTKTGEAFLSQITTKGNLYLFSTSFGIENTDFTRNALFVPVMQRIAEKSSPVNQQLAYDLDQSIIQLQLDSTSQNLLYKLTRDQDEIVPTQRANGNLLYLDLPKYLISPGYYDLTLKDKTFTTLAFNYSRLESQLEVLAVPEIEERISEIANAEIHVSPEINSFSKSMKGKYQRVELWKYALILSLVFLVAEILLIRYL